MAGHALAAVRLRRFIDPDAVVLGGGTVLAARYGHRDSTDLDLFCSIATSERIHTEHGERVWIDHLAEWLGDNAQKTIGAMGVTGTLDDVPFSVFPASGVLETGIPQQIEGHVIAAQTTHEILEGKILGRIADQDTENTIRDLYDITIAARLEPKAMTAVLAKLAKWPGQHAQAIKNLEETPANLHEIDSKPIAGARYALELANLAQRLVPMIKSGDPRRAPPTRPLPHSNTITAHREQER